MRDRVNVFILSLLKRYLPSEEQQTCLQAPLKGLIDRAEYYKKIPAPGPNWYENGSN
jgi:hypothetical protein